MKRYLFLVLVAATAGADEPGYNQSYGVHPGNPNNPSSTIILRERREINGGVETQEVIRDRNGNERKVRSWSSAPERKDHRADPHR